MNLFTAISWIFLATALSANATPRFALVRIKEIYSAMPSTVALQEEVKKEHEAIMKDKRAEKLRRIISELQALQEELADKNKTIDEANSRKLAQEYEIKRQEAQTLQQEFESFKTEQEKIINQKMVLGMRSTLNRIVAVSTKIAQERGYDSVFDGTGSTNTGVPFVLYSKEAPDLTADVEAALKDSLPSDSTAVEKPVETPTKAK